eukprot:396476-Amorphochlora_amoeboformis.AAC.2
MIILTTRGSGSSRDKPLTGERKALGYIASSVYVEGRSEGRFAWNLRGACVGLVWGLVDNR